MNFQQEQKIVIRRTPSPEISDRIRQGKKFIVVEDSFDLGNIPNGYSLVDVKYKGSSFKTLIPQSLIFYMANPGEGSIDDALDEISDFYGDVEDFEEDIMRENGTSVQETDWAVMARGSYRTYLINKLVKSGRKNNEGEPVPEFKIDELNRLRLYDPEVKKITKAIAALALGKSIEDVGEYSVDGVLRHVTFTEVKTEQLSREEFDRITCWAGSHYEIKPEFKDEGYKIEKRHDRDFKTGTRIITRTRTVEAEIRKFEDEIEQIRKEKGDEIGRHDRALVRQYVNLVHIANVDSGNQLDIMPSEGRVKNE